MSSYGDSDTLKNKPVLIDTVQVGQQPSGIAISSSGTFALIANRADKSVSVISIDGKVAKLVQTVAVNDEVAAVAITPDERRALIVKNSTNSKEKYSSCTSLYTKANK